MVRLSIALFVLCVAVPTAYAADPPKGSLTSIGQERFLLYYLEDLYRDTFPRPDGDQKPLFDGQTTKRLVSAQRGTADRIKAYVKGQKMDPRLVELCEDYKALLGDADTFADKQLKREKEYLLHFEKLREEFVLALIKAKRKAAADLFTAHADDELHLLGNRIAASGYSANFSLDPFGFSRSGFDPFAAQSRLFIGMARTRAAELTLSVRQIELFEEFEKRAEQLEQEQKPKLTADLQTNTIDFLSKFTANRETAVRTADKLARGLAADLHWGDDAAGFAPEPAGGTFTEADRKVNPFVPMRELMAMKLPKRDKEITSYVALARTCLTAAERVPGPKVRTNESVALTEPPAARMAAVAGLAANYAGFAELGDAGWKGGGKVPSADPTLAAAAWKKYANLDAKAVVVPRSFASYQMALALAHGGYHKAARDEIERANSKLCKANPEFCYHYARLSSLNGELVERTLPWLERASQLGYTRIADATTCSDLDRVRKERPKKLDEIISRR